MCVRHPSQVENISLLFNLFKRNSAIFHSGCKNSVILHDQASAVIQHGVSPVFHGLIRRFYNSPKKDPYTLFQNELCHSSAHRPALAAAVQTEYQKKIASRRSEMSSWSI